MRQDQKSNETPTDKSSPDSSSTSINSPEFRELAYREVNECLRLGYLQLPPEPPSPQPVRPVNDLDRRLAAQKWAELVQVLEQQGEEAFQKKLDEMFPGTQRNQLRNHIVRLNPSTGESPDSSTPQPSSAPKPKAPTAKPNT